MVTRYFVDLTASGDPAADVARFLRSAGRGDTVDHCQAVAAQARRLATRHRVDPGAAELAAGCHDLAAVVPLDEAVAVAESLGVCPDPVERAAPILLHGPIAAAVLPGRLGVTDPKVLDAIRYHSTGRPGASRLELVVLVADKIALDPRATARDLIPVVRQAAEASLERAALVYLDWVVGHAAELGWLLHPNVLGAQAHLRCQLGWSPRPG